MRQNALRQPRSTARLRGTLNAGHLPGGIPLDAREPRPRVGCHRRVRAGHPPCARERHRLDARHGLRRRGGVPGGVEHPPRRDASRPPTRVPDRDVRRSTLTGPGTPRYWNRYREVSRGGHRPARSARRSPRTRAPLRGVVPGVCTSRPGAGVKGCGTPRPPRHPGLGHHDRRLRGAGAGRPGRGRHGGRPAGDLYRRPRRDAWRARVVVQVQRLRRLGAGAADLRRPLRHQPPRRATGQPARSRADAVLAGRHPADLDTPRRCRPRTGGHRPPTHTTATAPGATGGSSAAVCTSCCTCRASPPRCTIWLPTQGSGTSSPRTRATPRGCWGDGIWTHATSNATVAEERRLAILGAWGADMPDWQRRSDWLPHPSSPQPR